MFDCWTINSRIRCSFFAQIYFVKWFSVVSSHSIDNKPGEATFECFNLSMM